MLLACLLIPLSGYCLDQNNLYKKPPGVKILPLKKAKVTDKDFSNGWVNYYREDDYCATELFYLKSPTNNLPPLVPLEKRIEGMK